MRFFRRSLYIAALLVLVGLGYIYRTDTQKIATHYIQGIRDIILPQPPCSEPIPYTIGDLDLRFKMSKAELERLLLQSEKMWETAIDKDLFVYATSTSAANAVTVNMLYDYRQQATNDLKQLDATIDADRARYSALKTEFNRLTSSYEQRKKAYEVDASALDARSAAYKSQVDYWNAQGGAPKKEYDKLQEERAYLENEANRLIKERNKLNSMVSKINTDIANLNALARKLNITVTNYNTTAQSAGEEFNEGEFIHDNDGTRINIYQFEDKQRLLRVIAHEFGHALGIEHVADEEAIMYRFNSGKGTSLTNDDSIALYQACELPTSQETI